MTVNDKKIKSKIWGALNNNRPEERVGQASGVIITHGGVIGGIVASISSLYHK